MCAAWASELSTGIHSLDYEVFGNGKPALFLHGLLSTHREWLPLAHDLAKKGFRSYMPDLFGHGGSPRPDNIHLYTARYQIQSCMEWMESLTLEPRGINLIGHSFGGFLALHIALKYGGAVDKIILINPLYEMGQFSTIHSFIFSKSNVFIRLWRRMQKMNVNSSRPRKFIRIPEKMGLCSPYILNIVHDMDTEPVEFRNIERKALLIWGAKDKTLNPQSFHLLLEKLPDATGYCLAEVGHLPHIRNHQETSKTITEFLSS